MKQQKEYLKISELSKLSGVPIQKLRYYMKKQVLFKPIKVNKTTGLYTQRHLERLKLINEMHHEKKVPIASIKKMIDSITSIERDGQPYEPKVNQMLSDQIMNLSIPVFRKKGFERTTITDICRAAGISRNTFYQFFVNKKELFIKCLEKLFLDWRRDAPDEKTPILEVMKNLSLAFYRVYPSWSDMMNLFRASATKYPTEFANRLEDSLKTRIRPIIEDVERGIRQGLFREVDSKLAAIVLAGAVDWVCYFMSRDQVSHKNASTTIDQMTDILFHGLMKKEHTT